MVGVLVIRPVVYPMLLGRIVGIVLVRPIVTTSRSFIRRHEALLVQGLTAAPF